MTFREATGADGPSVRSLLESSKLPTESLGTGGTSFFVAEEHGELAGIAGFEYYGRDALLRSVAVPSALREKGIGSQLVDFMLETARSRNVQRVVLLTETAEPFFSRKGFAAVPRAQIDNPALASSSEFTHACPTSAVCMVYPMDPPPGKDR